LAWVVPRFPIRQSPCVQADPWGYRKDVLERLLAHSNIRISELLPHRWKPVA
jgi:hypothetical protein